MMLDPLDDMYRCEYCRSWHKKGTQYCLKNGMPLCKHCYYDIKDFPNIEKLLERDYEREWFK
jgi:hypothetical protein